MEDGSDGTEGDEKEKARHEKAQRNRVPIFAFFATGARECAIQGSDSVAAHSPWRRVASASGCRGVDESDLSSFTSSFVSFFFHLTILDRKRKERCTSGTIGRRIK